jgi:hypothetical protein
MHDILLPDPKIRDGNEDDYNTHSVTGYCESTWLPFWQIITGNQITVRTQRKPL